MSKDMGLATSRLVIHHDSGNLEQFICPCRSSCEGMHDDKCFSYRHAVSVGWVFTQASKFSEKGGMVGVCPACASGFDWQAFSDTTHTGMEG